MFDPAYEPIGPGGGRRLNKRVVRFLQTVLIVLGIFLIWAWLEDKAPGWLPAFNFAMLLSSLLTGVQRKRKFGEIEARLTRLLAGGDVPDASAFYDALDNEPENPYEDLVNRYALGLISPQELKERMTAELKETR